MQTNSVRTCYLAFFAIAQKADSHMWLYDTLHYAKASCVSSPRFAQFSKEIYELYYQIN
ncbi:hypothetical protein JJB28_09695 [Campylobacter fetus subsp. venerealis]|uniref:hypothetical protein n=1 Tax=Campylobacter fetus TaxID=196 RepID=UPI00190B3E22|nr:hypothetical protein [Campylobacter fetus]MBK3505317.1 hypothetical protein [Campylobacter fetus subsp. venerealis]